MTTVFEKKWFQETVAGVSLVVFILSVGFLCFAGDPSGAASPIQSASSIQTSAHAHSAAKELRS